MTKPLDPGSVDIPGSPRDRALEEALVKVAQVKSIRDRMDTAERKLRLVNNLHQVDDTGKACDGCGATYPCKTRRIIDGSRP